MFFIRYSSNGNTPASTTGGAFGALDISWLDRADNIAIVCHDETALGRAVVVFTPVIAANTFCLLSSNGGMIAPALIWKTLLLLGQGLQACGYQTVGGVCKRFRDRHYQGVRGSF